MIDNPDMSQKEIERIRELMADGVAQHKAGKIASARRRYREVLKIDPDEPDALHFLGILAHQDNRNSEAIGYFERAINARKNFPAALQNLSKVLLIEESWEEALKIANNVLEADPNAHHALRTTAHAYQELHQFEKAYSAYKKIDELFPNEVGTIRNLALSLSGLRRREEAVEAYKRALKIEPLNVFTRLGLVDALNAAGRFEEALKELEGVLENKPDYIPALVLMGTTLEALDRFEEAVSTFRKAISIDPNHPESHFNLGLALLTSGDLSSGWEEYSWRLRTQAFIKQKPPTSAPLWKGEALEGKSILMFPEQGMGDSIQFVRYAALLEQQGATVHACCSQSLLRLLRTMGSIETVTELSQPIPKCDYQISMMELPRLCGTTRANIPGAEGYLDALDIQFSRPDNLSVGLVWKGNPSHERDMLRSIELERLSPLFDLDNVSFYSLQVGESEAQISEYGLQERIKSLSDNLTDFADTAAVISKLDLVISVDTSVAHLTGAIGKPVWLLLPTTADWRWGRSGEETPWYTSMRLFRQSGRGDWDGVVQRVRQSLETSVSEYKH